MTNREAIETIKTLIGCIEWDYPIDYSEALDIAIKALAEDNNVPCSGWISVKDRPPEVGQTVIGLSKYGHVSDMTLREIKNGELKHCLIFDPLGYLPGKDVKYWMPMPRDPEEEKDDDKR